MDRYARRTARKAPFSAFVRCGLSKQISDGAMNLFRRFSTRVGKELHVVPDQLVAAQ
jgi:hypothetical protein